MPSPLPFVHIAHLISELRLTASETLDLTASGDGADLMACVNAALMNDAADALESLAAERSANRPLFFGTRRDNGCA